ncbi:hypothetical protein [Sphaerospermopsis sp. LEGE 08334]|uniref:hypothetical protein n=1 Tax=Sphaerospermopsis sp. LEGE 08334 TaxID=1828651 RepID=UPI0018808C47|nr:hypothetical protein [Sphaerospermopsis sp. LEGE 08334]MBE9057833.1 hypothetical protein [Sphaerospermopsis sp. LEGE 08334]
MSDNTDEKSMPSFFTGQNPIFPKYQLYIAIVYGKYPISYNFLQSVFIPHLKLSFRYGIYFSTMASG